MNRYYALLITLLSALPLAHAQTLATVTGTLHDSTGTTVEFTTIALQRVTDSTVLKTELSDAAGQFRFESVPAGRYFVSTSLVGRARTRSAPFEVATEAVALPTITLVATGATTLNEVTVQGRKPLFERQADRTIVNVEGSSMSAGASSLEILGRAPGVTVDQNDNLSLRGKQGLLVLIDGKRQPMTGTELADMLRALPADQIATIELITNPPAKYDAAGSAGIIAINLKKDGRLGTNGTVNLSYGRGHYPRLTSGLSLNHRRNKLNLFGSYSYADRQNRPTLAIHRDFYSTGLFTGSSDQFNTGTQPVKSHTYKVGADYNLTKKTILGLTVTGLSTRIQPAGTSDAQLYDAQNQLFSTYSSTNNRSVSTSNVATTLSLRQTFAPAHELSIDADAAQYTSNRTQQLLTQYTLPVRSPLLLTNDQTGTLTINSLKTDYNQPLSKAIRLETGAKASWVRADNDVVFVNTVDGHSAIDTGKTNRFRYDEAISAGYLTLTYSTKSRSASVGLRGEHTSATGIQAVGNQNFDRHYFQLFPSASVKQTLSDKHELALSLSRRIDRPSYNQLNPFRSYIDPTTYGAGNPYLFPQLSYNVELTHTYRQKFTTSFGYSRTSQPIINTVQPAPEGGRIVTSTFQNLTRFDYYNMTFSLPIEPVKGWRIDNNIVVYYAGFVGDLAGTALNRGRVNVNINTTSTVTLGRTWTADLNATYQGRDQYGFLFIQPFGQVTIGAQKSLWAKKGTLRLNATDIFFTNKIRATSTYDNYIEQFRQYQDSRVVTLSLSYRFGNQNVGAGSRRSGGAEDEKRRASGGA